MDEIVESVLEQIIRQNLKLIREQQDNPIRIKIQHLRDQFQVIEQGKKYHDKIFAFLNTGKHYIFKEELNEQKLLNFYHECQQILAEIQGKSTPDIEYVIYYKKGKNIHRIQVKEIPGELLRLHKGTGAANDPAQLRLRKVKSVLEKMAETQVSDDKLIEHYAEYKDLLIKSYKGEKPIPNATISLGRISEAFERHLKKIKHSMEYNDIIDIGQAWIDIRESMGTAPWYTGGDVDNLQVKSIITGGRGLFNLNSIEDLINFFDYLISPVNEAYEENEIIDNFHKIILREEPEINDQLKQQIIEHAKEMTLEFLGSKLAKK